MINWKTILIITNILLLGLVGYLVLRQRAGGETLKVDDKTGESFYHRNEVKNTISKKLPALSKCYDSFTASNPAKKDGNIKIDWQITPSGKTQTPEVIANELGTDVAAKALADCALQEIQSWQFPEPPTGRSVYVAHKFFFGKPPKREAPRMVNVK